jgi:hypothetical protein
MQAWLACQKLGNQVPAKCIRAEIAPRHREAKPEQVVYHFFFDGTHSQRCGDQSTGAQQSRNGLELRDMFLVGHMDDRVEGDDGVKTGNWRIELGHISHLERHARDILARQSNLLLRNIHPRYGRVSSQFSGGGNPRSISS